MTTSQFLLLLAVSPFADAGEDAKTLQTIRAAVREQLSSINSLQLKFHEYDLQANVHLADSEWVISGDKYLLAIGPGQQTPGGPQTRTWYSFDGKKSYSTEYEPKDLSKVRSISRTSFNRFYYVTALSADAAGSSRLIAADETFLAVLDHPTAKLLGNEEVEGRSCWKVDLGMLSYKGKPTNRLIAWFDPEVGYWARKVMSNPDIVPRTDGQPTILGDGQMPWSHTAIEFDQFDDMALGGKRWFPTHYKMGSMQRTTEVIFDEIEINPTIPDSRFTPEIPEGMLITDEPGTPDQVSYYAGGDAGYEIHKKRAMEAAAALSKSGPGNPLIDAQNDTALKWTTVLLALSSVIVVVGCGFWWRARARG